MYFVVSLFKEEEVIDPPDSKEVQKYFLNNEGKEEKTHSEENMLRNPSLKMLPLSLLERCTIHARDFQG